MAYIARLQRELVLTLESTGMGDSEAVDDEDMNDSEVINDDDVDEDENDKLDENEAKDAIELCNDGSSIISYGLNSSPMFISEEEDN